MDLLHQDVRHIYKKYLAAAFGSAMIGSIYGLVDMAMVGQYQGPIGTAALAVVAPIWNIIYSLGLLTGIGGSVLYGTAKGRASRDGERENEYFTAACIGTAVLAAVCWAAVVLFDRQLLELFGASGEILPIARQYLLPIKFVVPLYMVNQMLAAFLRNDGAPGLATAAVLAGGAVNVVGDYAFVFLLDMGAMGAGLATALCAVLTTLVMAVHFFTRQNTLRLVRTGQLGDKLRRIGTTGFSTFFIDVAMGFLTMLFNRQIMRYLGADALAVYGVIVNISTIVQCCAYSVGQAAQPIFSINYGAGNWQRMRQVLRYALYTVAVFGLAWTAVMWLFPTGLVRIFMAPTPAVLQIAPSIMRCYGISFLLLPLNVFSTYYFQSLMRPRASFWISVARGAAVSGALICVLPAVFGPAALWLCMPVTELVVAVAAIGLIRIYTRTLTGEPATARQR